MLAGSHRIPVCLAALLALACAPGVTVQPTDDWSPSETGESTELGPENSEADRIVAVVNDQIVRETDLELWMGYDDEVGAELQRLRYPSEAQLARKVEELRPAALDRLIVRMLMLEHAAQLGVTASEAELDNYLQNLARNLNLGGIPELERAVEESLHYGSWGQYRAKLHDDIVLFELEASLFDAAGSDPQARTDLREQLRGRAHVDIRL